MVQLRSDWERHVDQIARSQRYTWLGEGLSGDPLDEALVRIAADMMHLCARKGLSWEAIMARGQAQFDREEAEHRDATRAGV